VKVRLVDTVFRIEHVPKEGVGGVALEIHVKKCVATIDVTVRNELRKITSARSILPSFFILTCPTSIQYFDEAGVSTVGNSPDTMPVPEQKEGNVYEVASCSTKKFILEGISIYTDEYPAEARTFIRDPLDLCGSATEV
jgi:hypothetical protein